MILKRGEWGGQSGGAPGLFGDLSVGQAQYFDSPEGQGGKVYYEKGKIRGIVIDEHKNDVVQHILLFFYRKILLFGNFLVSLRVKAQSDFLKKRIARYLEI